MMSPLRVVAAVTACMLLVASLHAESVVLVDAGRGPVAVRVPDSYDPSVPMPLLLALHGYGGSGADFVIGTFVDDREILYVAPTGTVDPTGAAFWNATPGCCDFFGTNIDDSGYLAALIDEVKAALNVDPTRVHVFGYSNGGFMAHVLACDHAGVIASFASVAGAAYNNPANCAASESVHALQIHGTNDTVIAYGGGSTPGGNYPGALETVDQWIGVSSCNATGTAGAPIDLVVDIAGAETTVTSWTTDCTTGGSAELWTVNGGGHLLAFQPDFLDRLFDWFDAHTQPVVGATDCPATLNSTGKPAALQSWGALSATAGEPISFVADDLPSGQTGAFLLAPTDTALPFGGGTLCVGPPFLTLPLQIPDAAGEARLSGVMPVDATLAGAVVHLQYAFFDAGGPAPINLTNALALTLTP